MTYRWEYPVFLFQIDGGFAAVKIDSVADERQFAVVAFTDESRCEKFAESLELEGHVAKLNTDREFAALVSLLRPPFSSIVFDPTPEGTLVNADWQVDIPTLLAHYLPLAKSPWDYPLFALRETEGYTAISGAVDAGDTFVAVCLFTRRELADNYMKNAATQAAVIQLDDPRQLGNFLAGLPASITAAAFNPTAEQANRTAKHCLRIDDIRAKYLPTYD